jgi:hypothetical protein
MFVSGAYVLWGMEETHPEFGTHSSVQSVDRAQARLDNTEADLVFNAHE